MSTNYFSTFITAAPDCPADEGTVPTKAGSIAQRQYALLSARPYALTSDDLLFEVHAMRQEIGQADRAAERAAFFEKSQACLRASPLVKQFGWGIHHDDHGRIALHGVETDRYRDFSKRSDLKIVAGMRSRRA